MTDSARRTRFCKIPWMGFKEYIARRRASTANRLGHLSDRRKSSAQNAFRIVASRDLKEESHHVVPRPPGRRTSTCLGARTDHPQAGTSRAARTAGRRERQLDLARPGEFLAGLRTSVSDWGQTIEVEGRVKNQGGGTTTAPFEITIYASPIRGINRYSVPVGYGRDPRWPGCRCSRSLSDLGGDPVHADPQRQKRGGHAVHHDGRQLDDTVVESNYHNNEDLGPPYDTSPVMIGPKTPANLVGTTLAVSPTNPTWGSTITVTAQITNQSSGASPQTRALLSLTPQGLNYGGSTTVGIGSITVPPLGPYQTINLVQNITLPAVEPSSIANYTNFGLTMTQDANYVTNDLYPDQPNQGVGLDQAAHHDHDQPDIDGHGTALSRTWPPRRCMLSRSSVNWGSTVQVSTRSSKPGLRRVSRPRRCIFVLTGQNGSLTDAIFLGQTTIPALAAGASAAINQTLHAARPVARRRVARAASATLASNC